MNDTAAPNAPQRYSPLGQMILARLREFYREPAAIFWVYGFPILIVVALGIAFRNKPVEHIPVDVEQEPGATARIDLVRAALAQDERLVVAVHDPETCRRRLRTGKTDLVVVPAASEPGYEYVFDPTRPESLLRAAPSTTCCSGRPVARTRYRHTIGSWTRKVVATSTS